MNGDLIATLILFVPSGLPFLIGGYFIAFKKRTDLIAGWDKDRVHSPDTFATVFGWGLIFCSILLFVSAYLLSAKIFGFGEFFGSVIFVVVLTLAIGQYCVAKFSN